MLLLIVAVACRTVVLDQLLPAVLSLEQLSRAAHIHRNTYILYNICSGSSSNNNNSNNRIINNYYCWFEFAQWRNLTSFMDQYYNNDHAL